MELDEVEKSWLKLALGGNILYFEERKATWLTTIYDREDRNRELLYSDRTGV